MKDFEHITEENSFLKLYKSCRKIKHSKDNVVIFWLSLVFFFFVFLISNDSNDDVVNSLVSFGEEMISYLMTIVGFVLAGYAIYATLSEKSMQLAMSTVKDRSSNLTFLQSSHCTFIKICIDLVLICGITFFITREPLLKLIYLTESEFNSVTNIHKWSLLLLHSMSYAMFILSLLLSKSFIYNVYHSIMTSIRWYAENSNSEPLRRVSGPKGSESEISPESCDAKQADS